MCAQGMKLRCEHSRGKGRKMAQAVSQKGLGGGNCVDVITHTDVAILQQELAHAEQRVQLVLFLPNVGPV